MVSQGKTRHPASHFRFSSPRSRAASLSKTPNTLEPLPANKAPHAPASSKALLARSISGSISKITLSKSLRRGHCLLSAEFRSARELERIEAELEVVKEVAFRDAYAFAVETLAFGVMTIRYCFGPSGRGVRVVPMPVARHRPPVRKNGTSAPRKPRNSNSSIDMDPFRHNTFKAKRETAAFDDAPPKPPWAGILFVSLMSAFPAH